MSKVIQTVEELDAVLHWRRKHAQAIRALDAGKDREAALQQRLTAADERADVLITALSRVQFRCQSFAESDLAMAVESVEAVLSIADAALKPAEGGGDACEHSEGNKRGCPECGEVFKP
ncbi:hypothetical protein C4J88_2972 [Pseudomonas sp. R4-39-08]|uniref:hypothetical protein n=1 Tax=Pseudomonas sp. R4-39-08 TaxID=1173288 RepID=UPI000F55AA50|nr:hypothetical protein [Pseudomonas sp. R4-39-08]AZF37752.1 hypothetical protein C4J88_2972 [Pseudomonas sp. R4-39-08]